MNKVLRDTVYDIAMRARDWVQTKAEWSDYNPDDLNGWCAIASGHLHRILKLQGIDATIHLHNTFGNCHAFVVVEDYVVDITATQFLEFLDVPVVIMHVKEAEVHEFYQSDITFESATELRKHQKRENWPSYQIAYPT